MSTPPRTESPSIGRARALAALVVAALCWGCASGARRPPVSDLAVANATGGLVLPEAPEFVFGAGDEIDIRVWRQDDLNMTIKVAPDGTISYPLVGRLQIGGLTYPQLQELLREKIAQYYVDPQVSINISKIASMKVYVLGYVKAPQILQIESGMDVVEALTRVGWLTEDSRTDNIMLVRGGLEAPKVYAVDLERYLNKGDVLQNVPLEKGDIIYVPQKTIANVEKFFRSIAGIISPFVSGTVVYRNATTGNTVGAGSALDN